MQDRPLTLKRIKLDTIDDLPIVNGEFMDIDDDSDKENSFGLPSDQNSSLNASKSSSKLGESMKVQKTPQAQKIVKKKVRIAAEMFEAFVYKFHWISQFLSNPGYQECPKISTETNINSQLVTQSCVVRPQVDQSHHASQMR